MLNVRQAAAAAGVSTSLVYEWCAAGTLAHYRLGRQGRRGKILIDEAELKTFLTRCRQEAREQRPPMPELLHIKLA